jgi:DnaJ-class molecular chaperone
MFFGNTFSKRIEPKEKGAKRGENIETEINISLEDAFNRKRKINRVKNC